MKSVFLTVVTFTLSTATLLAQQWEPYTELGDLYPAYAIAVSNIVPDEDDQKDETLLGDPNGVLGILFTPTRANTNIKLEIRCNDDLRLFGPAVIDVVAPRAGQEYLIRPVVPFNHTTLASLGQSSTIYVTYTLTIDGQQQAPRTERLRVRSINDCPFAVVEEEKETPIDFVFAAYVNEDHPWIEEILQEALRKNYVDSFVGSQGGETVVYEQVLAIWRVLQERGIRYSSIAPTAATSLGVASQHVRLLDESIRYTQANCVDGAVLLASILRKIDINPILVVLPGHMFVGFDLDAEGDQQAYLETTRMGVDARETEPVNNRLSKTLLGADTDLKAQVAVKSFVSALESGKSTFAGSRVKILREKAGYALVDISAARNAGVTPIMYVSK
ncbi:hypothetical protein [Spirosoma arcticum]